MLLITYEDLRDNVLDRAEEEMGVSESEFASLTREYLDRAYFELLGRRVWLFAKAQRPLVIPLLKPIETLTATWAQGSYVATLSANPGRDLTDWIARVGEWEYRIVSHNFPSPTQVMFDTPGPDSDAFPAGWAGQPLFLFKHEYDMLEIMGASPTPSAVLVSTAGVIPAGTYDYTCTAVGKMGETMRGTASNPVTIADQNVAGQVDVTVPAAPYPNVRGRFIFRRKSTELEWFYVGAVFGGNSSAVFRDNLAAPSPSRTPAQANTTAIVRQIIDIWPRDESWALVKMEQSDLRRSFSDPIDEQDPPRAYTRVSQNRIRLSSYSRSANVLEVEHTELTPPLSESIEYEIKVPKQWRFVLADYALGLLLEQKHSDRAKFWLDRFEVNVAQMYAEDELSRQGYGGLRQASRREPGR